MKQVWQWHVYEAVLTAGQPPDDAADETSLKVEFAAPSGARRTVNGFWDGGQTWRVRFSPDQIGQWTWQSRCADGTPGLASQGQFSCIPYEGDNPLYTKGPLKVSANRRHLAWGDGERFFWLADTAWNGVLCSRENDWDRYLQTRHGQGFTAIQFVTTTWRAFEKDRQGLTSFVESPRFRIVPEFFRKLDAKVSAVNAHGLIASPVMIWSCRPNDPGRKLGENEILRLARYIQARWGAHQVVWILGGDGNYEPNGEMWSRVGHALFDQRHDRLVTMHMGGQQWTAEQFRGQSWFDFIGYQSGHGDAQAHLQWLVQGPPVANRDNQPPLPVINMEPNYEMHPSYDSKSFFGAFEVRRACYWSLLLGPTAGVTFGVSPIWCWLEKAALAPGHESLGMVEAWQVGIETPGTAAMTLLRQFFEELPWEHLQPAQQVLADQPGGADPTRFIAAAASPEDRLTVLYLPVGGTVKLNPDKLVGAKSARWFDPRRGRYAEKTALPQPPRELTAPSDEDWLLVLTDA